jgi:cardiolipin synthase
MPHAKIVTIDSVLSTLGSANKDQHGTRLSFEANAFLFSVETVSEMERNFLDLYRRQKK